MFCQNVYLHGKYFLSHAPCLLKDQNVWKFQSHRTLLHFPHSASAATGLTLVEREGSPEDQWRSSNCCRRLSGNIPTQFLESLKLKFLGQSASKITEWDQRSMSDVKKKKKKTVGLFWRFNENGRVQSNFCPANTTSLSNIVNNMVWRSN